jgi:ERCC4-type nuclease
MTAAPVSPPLIPVLAKRGGTQLKAPLGVVLVDTREQWPFDFSCFAAWFGGVEKRALDLGDYTIAGLKDICIVERKNLFDLVRSFTVERLLSSIGSAV